MVEAECIDHAHQAAACCRPSSSDTDCTHFLLDEELPTLEINQSPADEYPHSLTLIPEYKNYFRR